MTDNRYTRSMRGAVVESMHLYSTKPSDVWHPREHLALTPELSLEDLKGEVWHVVLTIKTDFDQSNTSIIYFGKQKEAIKCAEKYAVGTIIRQDNVAFPIPFKTLFSDGANNPLGLFGAGDTDFFLCYDVLEGAGLMGPDPRETFGENWGLVADLEYCLNHFPLASMATVACKVLYNYFVQNDDFSAGYLYRELEMMHGCPSCGRLFLARAMKLPLPIPVSNGPIWPVIMPGSPW